ncbi:MAG: hypothetical protein DSZ03_06855 [Sulfurimonas sp.]|nr:MAG: hypothetical protein DSZ03_06855 [Sulfurimonas sp.]
MRQQSFYLLSFVFLMGCATTQPPSPTKNYVPIPLKIAEESQAFRIDEASIEPMVSTDVNRTSKTEPLQEQKKHPVTKTVPKSMKKPKASKSSPPAKKPKKILKKPKKASVKTIKKTKVEKVSSSSNAKILIGSVELVRIIPGNKVELARVDTGAKTTSLHAVNMQVFERDGREYVRFSLNDRDDALRIERPIWKWVRIKRHEKKSQRRPVIKLRLVLGNNDQLVAVTLTDRSKFKHPILIGRNFLRDIYIVDVARKQTSRPKEYRK